MTDDTAQDPMQCTINCVLSLPRTLQLQLRDELRLGLPRRLLRHLVNPQPVARDRELANWQRRSLEEWSEWD